jgi:hypothetical protein
VDEIASEIVSQKRDQQKLKKMCLERDGNRCMVTGHWEGDNAPAGVRTTRTQAVHILPFCLANLCETQVRAVFGLSWQR